MTYNRLPILTSEKARKILRLAWLDVRNRFPFTTEAICLLPNHLHCIWTLPDDDSRYSLRWKEIKRLFIKGYLTEVGIGEERNNSRIARGEAAIWQRRFWEHTIRDEEELNRHIDYIHYNPLKHGLVKNVEDWQWSSFHRYLQLGFYGDNWEKECEERILKMDCGE